MDFVKLVSLFENESMYFARLDTLDDKMEGSFSSSADLKRIESERNRLDYTKNLQKDKNTNNQHLSIMEELFQAEQEFRNSFPRHAFANCWHTSDHESYAMWMVYSNRQYGVAIRSKISKLIDCFEDTHLTVNIGKVKYIDFVRESNYARLDEYVKVAYTKRLEYRFEDEIRCIVNGYDDNNKVTTINAGLNVKINVNKLIECIYIAPQTGTWLKELVEQIVKQYNYDFQVVHSPL